MKYKTTFDPLLQDAWGLLWAVARPVQWIGEASSDKMMGMSGASAASAAAVTKTLR